MNIQKQVNPNDQPLPHSTETEQVVLGALLLEHEAFDKIQGILTPESFYHQKHQIIYAAIARLKRESKPVDLITVVQSINSTEVTPFDLVELTNRVASAGHIEAHAAIIAELKTRRDYITKAHEIIKMGHAGALVDELFASWENHSKKVLEDTTTDTPKEIREILPEIMQAANQSEDNFKRVSTGFPKIDKHLGGGLTGGRVYIIGARPGQGKTSIALNLSALNAINGLNILFFSLEQSATDLATKIIAGLANVGHGNIETGKLTAEQWHRIDKGVSQLSNCKGKFFLCDKVKSVEHLTSTIKKLHKNYCLNLVVIDYLQLIPSTNKTTVREQEIATISRTIKQLSMSENLPIVALSQLNRGATGEPRLSQLRESGAIEQDADVVILIYRPALDGDTDESPDNGKLIIAKNRRGTIGEVPFYNRNMSEFSEQPFENAF